MCSCTSNLSNDCNCNDYKVSTGPQGATGVAGPQGPLGPPGNIKYEYIDTDSESTTSSSGYETLDAHTSNSLVNNGDTLIVEFYYSVSGANDKYASIQIDSKPINYAKVDSVITLAAITKLRKVKLTLTKIGADSAQVLFETDNIVFDRQFIFTSLNFTALVIKAVGSAEVNEITKTRFSVYKIEKV